MTSDEYKSILLRGVENMDYRVVRAQNLDGVPREVLESVFGPMAEMLLMDDRDGPAHAADDILFMMLGLDEMREVLRQAKITLENEYLPVARNVQAAAEQEQD